MRMIISDDNLRRKVVAWFLDLICPLPERTGADERAFNADVWEMSEQERKADFERVRLRLLLDPAPSYWLLERFNNLAEMEAAMNVKPS